MRLARRREVTAALVAAVTEELLAGPVLEAAEIRPIRRPLKETTAATEQPRKVKQAGVGVPVRSAQMQAHRRTGMAVMAEQELRLAFPAHLLHTQVAAGAVYILEAVLLEQVVLAVVETAGKPLQGRLGEPIQAVAVAVAAIQDQPIAMAAQAAPVS
jgi:hypothetical protein